MNKASILRTWQEFDDTLKEIALIDIAVAEAEAVRQNDLVVAQANFERRTREQLGRKTILAVELERFYASHRKERETGAKKSVEMTYGRAGMRKAKPALTRLKGWSWEKVIACMEASAFWKAFIQYKPQIGKQAVRDAMKTEEELAAIGLRVKEGKEEFFFETFPEKVGGAQ